MAKSLCKLKKKLLKGDIDRYIDLVRDPEYVCTKCGRVAGKEKRLCKPKAM